ncbi:MAG: hypothetical protein ACFFB5_20560 [Promethearchaeota archaeon]
MKIFKDESLFNQDINTGTINNEMNVCDVERGGCFTHVRGVSKGKIELMKSFLLDIPQMLIDS